MTSAKRTKRLALQVGAAASRRLLVRRSMRTAFCVVPESAELQSIPGDKGHPLLGHALPAATVPIEFLQSQMATYGSVSWIRGFAMRMVLALGPAASQEVLTNSDRVFSQEGQQFFSGRFFKRGLM